MDIKLLEAFCAVMESQSVTGAARMMGVTQPAVSAQIARLEAHVGFPLFERVGGRLKASPGGRRFHAEVTNALSMIDRLGDVAENIRTGSTDTLVVASHPSASISLLPEVVAELRAANPQARIRMINRTSEAVRAIFEAGGVDVAVTEWPVNLQGIDLKRYEVPTVAILPRDHPAAALPVLTPAALSGAPFIAMPDSRLIGHRIRAVFSDHGAVHEPVVESEYFSTICGLVAAGVGVSIVDRWSARSFAPLGLVVRPFEPAIRYEITVFRRADRRPSPLADDLLARLDRWLTHGPPEDLAEDSSDDPAQERA